MLARCLAGCGVSLACIGGASAGEVTLEPGPNSVVRVISEAQSSPDIDLYEGVTANVSPEVSVELLGVRDLTPKRCWLPHGPEIPLPENWPAAHVTRGSNASHQLTFHCVGLQPGQVFAFPLERDAIYPVGWNFEASVRDFSVAYSLGGKKTVDLQLGLAAPFGPWQRIELDGKAAELQNVPESHQSVSRKVSSAAVEPTQLENRTASSISLHGLKEIKGLQVDYVAVDVDGKRHRRGASSVSNATGIQMEIIVLPAVPLDHFEYRLRPVTHWITFKNVSLLPGTETECEAVVEPVETQEKETGRAP